MRRSFSPRFGDLVFPRFSRDEFERRAPESRPFRQEGMGWGNHERQRGGSIPMGLARLAREAGYQSPDVNRMRGLAVQSIKNYMIETIRFVRRGSNLLKPGQMLSLISIETADQHGAALAVPTLFHREAECSKLMRGLLLGADST